MAKRKKPGRDGRGGRTEGRWRRTNTGQSDTCGLLNGKTLDFEHTEKLNGQTTERPMRRRCDREKEVRGSARRKIKKRWEREKKRRTEGRLRAWPSAQCRLEMDVIAFR